MHVSVKQTIVLVKAWFKAYYIFFFFCIFHGEAN